MDLFKAKAKEIGQWHGHNFQGTSLSVILKIDALPDAIDQLLVLSLLARCFSKVTLITLSIVIKSAFS